MLHILWLAVKWTGILLVSLLALILLGAVLVLSCPFRYRAEIEKTADEWGAQGKISWLFGLIRVTVRGSSQKTGVEIRICGIRLSSLKRLFSRKKGRAEKKPDIQGSLPAAEIPRMEGDILKGDIPKEDSFTENIYKEGIRGGRETVKKDPTGSEDHAEKHGRQKECLLKRFWVKITEKCRGIKEAFGKFLASLRNMRDKAGLWKKFLEDPHTGAAMGMAWQQICRFLRHAGPQKWEGAVYLGLEDPAATGQILAVLGAVYPIYGGRLTVDPVWDRKILEGKVSVKGRVYGIAVLCIAVKIYFDKNIRYVIKWFRRNGGNYVTGS